MVAFEDLNKTLVIDVTDVAGFALGDVLTVEGMAFKTFLSSTVASDNLESFTDGVIGLGDLPMCQ